METSLFIPLFSSLMMLLEKNLSLEALLLIILYDGN